MRGDNIASGSSTDLTKKRLLLVVKAPVLARLLIWRSNDVRELGNTIERAKILVKQRESTEIDAEDILFDKPANGPAATIARLELALPTAPKEITKQNYDEFTKIAEREYLRHCLEIMDGRTVELSQRMGISRGLIYRKMAQLGIPRRGYGLRTESQALEEGDSDGDSHSESAGMEGAL